jgi:hypothetical protein
MRRPDEAYASTGDDRQVLSADEGLAAALSRLETILDRSGAAIVPLFHPGIGQPEVLGAFDGIGLTPSAEVVTWFGWHNGAGGPGMPTTLIELVPGGEFYGAHDLCREYVQARSVALEVDSGIGRGEDSTRPRPATVSVPALPNPRDPRIERVR